MEKKREVDEKANKEEDFDWTTNFFFIETTKRQMERKRKKTKN